MGVRRMMANNYVTVFGVTFTQVQRDFFNGTAGTEFSYVSNVHCPSQGLDFLISRPMNYALSCSWLLCSE